MDKENATETLEESIFKTLNHQKRSDILRVIGEKKNATFTEIKTAIETEDSPSISYHLNALASLTVQKEGKYCLSELGQDAYNLICKATTYSASNSLLTNVRKILPAVIIANAILWAAALFVVRQLEGHLNQFTVFSISALWLISNGILYSLLTTIRERGKCITSKVS